jgi:hypothetical protein
MIDACAFHDWISIEEVIDYMPKGWQQLALRPGSLAGPLLFRDGRLYTNPLGSRDGDVRKENESNFDAFVRNLLEDEGTDRVVLGYDDAILNTAYPHLYAAQVAVRATNDWTVDRWLSADNQLYGMVLVSTAIPDMAAAEIRRVGANERMVAVALGASALDKTFGHPVYKPIYEACDELSLPVVIQAGLENFGSHLMPPVAGGLPATYSEYYALNYQAVETHVSRMVMHGVFEQHPNLKVLVVGGGASWVPSLLWKMDFSHNTVGPGEAPWLRRPPSEYFREHVRVSTYQLERSPKPESLIKALGTVPWFSSVLLYASGYPSWDRNHRAGIAERLPAGWHEAVFDRNAMGFFRWPDEPRSTSVVGKSSEDMIESIG